MQKTDSQLISDYLKGEDSAFTCLLERHLKPTYNFICRLVGNLQDVQDITQDTFVKTWQNLKKYRPNREGQESGGFSAGQIIAKDEKSVTIKMQDGSSKIVFYSESTKIQKTADGTGADLAIDQEVTASGAANSDGSLTAQTIQVRPDVQIPNPNN